MKRTFVGFGFGAIQAGLFLYEAHISGNFDRLVIGYRRPEVIQAIRDNNGFIALNIAHQDHIETVQLGPIELYDVKDNHGQAKLIEALIEATEIATALSSVKDYESESNGSVHKLLARTFQAKQSQAIVYAAENDNHAAEKLRTAVLSELKDNSSLAKIQFLNTVVGKMSGVVADSDLIHKFQLKTIAPNLDKAFLVETFSSILISEIKLPAFQRGITSFAEKPDLLPFEEAKLYGHNATHALAAYLGTVLKLDYIRDLATVEGALGFLRDAFLLESGASLLKKHAGVDYLFTEQGYAESADNLLLRMMNPYLNDSVERVGRDVTRKLGWNDRLIGTLREAKKQGFIAKRYAFGVAAALESIGQDNAETFLKSLWQLEDSSELENTLEIVKDAKKTLALWKAKGKPNLQDFFNKTKS